MSTPSSPPRQPDTPTEAPPASTDQAQSPSRATMDPLPPVTNEDLPVGLQGARHIKSGESHREDVPDQRPVPSEWQFPPVKDDRLLKLHPGPPTPDDE